MHDKSFTVIGSRGYIGTRLSRYLDNRGAGVRRLDRYDCDKHGKTSLGHVIFAAGVTADFRVRPFDTMEAHVSSVGDILRSGCFDSFLYLSSTRVYQGAASTREDERLVVTPADPLQLYNVSKLAGEALCLAMDRPQVRVARLSNVYGSDDPSGNFLIDIVRAAVHDGHVELRSDPNSAKDFVSICDVETILPELAIRGRHRLYNVASGRNVAYSELLARLREETGCTVSIAPDSPLVWFPEISIRRLTEEFSIEPVSLADDIINLINDYKSMQL